MRKKEGEYDSDVLEEGDEEEGKEQPSQEQLPLPFPPLKEKPVL